MTDGTISLNNRFGWGDRYSGSSNIRNKSFYNNLYLELSQPLFTYNRTKLEVKEVELDHENAMLSYAMQMLNLEKSVSQFFYDVYFSQMNLEIRKEEYDNTQKTFEIINNKVDAGLSAREELYQSAVNLATAKSNVENQRVALDNAKDVFKQYIGMDIFEPVTVMTDVQVSEVEVDEKKAIEHGVLSRMEIRQREIDVETSQFDLIRTKSQNEFRGDMNLSIGLFGDDEDLANVFDNPTRSPKAKISFNLPLFDWGERKARIRAQEAVIKSRELNLDNEVIKIKIDIRKVVRNLQNLLNQIDIAEQNEKNSQLTYDINVEKYENGDLTGMDLNLVQTQLSEKKLAYAQSLIDYRIELLNLKIQTLYDFTKDEPVVPDVFFEEYKSKLKN
jgi:outer membrane protein TolC